MNDYIWPVTDHCQEILKQGDSITGRRCHRDSIQFNLLGNLQGIIHLNAPLCQDSCRLVSPSNRLEGAARKQADTGIEMHRSSRWPADTTYPGVNTSNFCSHENTADSDWLCGTT
ncbi:MAG: hypothetical protein V3S33_01555 [Gammaproteobacteria bacterium]